MMASLVLARLTGRKLLKIYGPDCYPYLQGLICNDLRYLYEPNRIPERRFVKKSSNVLSSFMLNPLGRAICDMILYRTHLTRTECQFNAPGKSKEPDELLIECDANLASGLANTLYGYRVLRKIAIAMEERLNAWCLFPNLDNEKNKLDLINPEHNYNLLTDLNTSNSTTELISHDLTIVPDPRLTNMGFRVLTSQTDFEEVKKSIQSVINVDINQATPKDYMKMRYMLGVGEGIKDHPESNCFPLECNADFLNSVSYTKGCYLGQELTARIHYTGVVRKRLMPVKLDLSTTSKELGSVPLAQGTDIIAIENKNKKVGILRHILGDRGLALLRHDSVKGSQQLIHAGSGTQITASIPYWWMIDDQTNNGAASQTVET